ncbi:MAG TPA: glycyl-radical enzyme activating protein [Deltaproteobacteria bacterium]|jgi:pyruvate formate lyase activating enzyme|nr:glycyl-radical enzyme activating protein [Deltaproteobacteria bacterium]HOI06621.1 glycyl-radical enzyme activating protein [Deltaproteobacteria bacterium]
MKEKGLIFEVKGNSLDDGPGIRTVVFFKGCPLSCVWCHNPESKKAKIELRFDREKCIGCGSCTAVCREGALRKEKACFIDREKCTLCLACVNECPSTALSQVGVFWSLEDLMKEILKDAPFFKASGGGITLSGGEPTLYMDFASRVLRSAREQGVSTLLETCGLFDEQRFLEVMYPHLDMIYFDLKLFDESSHKRYCGVGNEVILRNFGSLSRICSSDGKVLLPRVPLIPGITATAGNLTAIARFLEGLGISRVELLPYNPLWFSKTESLGQSSPLSGQASMKEWMPLSQVEECKGFFAGFDVR